MLLDGVLHQRSGCLFLRGASKRPPRALPDDLIPKGMKGADFHAPHAAPFEPVLHLIPGFLVERQRQDPFGGDPLVEQVQDAVHQRLGLARTRRSQHPDRSADGRHRLPLAGVQVIIQLVVRQVPRMDCSLDFPDAFLHVGFDLRARKPADRIARQRQSSRSALVSRWFMIGFALTLDDNLPVLHAHQKIDYLAPQAHLRLVGQVLRLQRRPHFFFDRCK